MSQVNYSALELAKSSDAVELVCYVDAEMDEMWSYVQKKSEPRWLWYAIDHNSSKVLAYVLGRRKDKVFQNLKSLLTLVLDKRVVIGSEILKGVW